MLLPVAIMVLGHAGDSFGLIQVLEKFYIWEGYQPTPQCVCSDLHMSSDDIATNYDNGYDT